MVDRKKFFKRISHFKPYYLIILFLLIVGLTGIIILIKMFLGESHTLYARIKVSQGLWWATTQKPAIWLANNLQKGDIEMGLSGKPIVEILEVQRYPFGVFQTYNEQYEVYLTVKMDVSYNKRQKKYMFKRATLAVGSPVDLIFQKAEVSGTIIALSEEPFQTTYKDVEVTLVKTEAYPWEFDAIQVGDSYKDQEITLFEVLDKNFQYSNTSLRAKQNGYITGVDDLISIEVRGRLRVSQQGDLLLYREDVPLQIGKKISVQTSSYVFDQYTIKSIKE